MKKSLLSCTSPRTVYQLLLIGSRGKGGGGVGVRSLRVLGKGGYGQFPIGKYHNIVFPCELPKVQ